MSTERAVETLMASDPDFGLLCDVLYGPGVDPAEVWSDVFGFAKADTYSPDRLEGRLAAASTLTDEVSKIKVPGVKALARGIAQGWKRAEQSATHMTEVTPEVAATNAKQAQQGAKAFNTVRHPIRAAKANPGKTAIGAVGVGALAEHKRANRPISYADVPQDAYYGKRDVPEFEAAGEFTKFDDDKRLAFGWASVVKKDGVEVVDRQGDWIDPEDLENAAYKYVLSSRIGGDMHKRNGDAPHHVSDLVESFVVTPEKIAKMGLPESTPIGWWVGFKVHDDDTWDLVKKKGRTGFSIHGRGKRAMHELDF